MPAALPQPAKTLRKTISVGSFPQPPKGISSRTNASGPSPLSAAASVASHPDGLPTDRRSSSSSLTVPSGDSTMRTRSASAKSRQSLLRSPHAMPSPQTRTPSAGSNLQTVDTPGSEGNDAHDAGKDTADKTSNESKGNVVVSVRVRPQAGTADDVNHGDWDLDGRRGSITYSGKEGGQFTSGMNSLWIVEANMLTRVQTMFSQQMITTPRCTTQRPSAWSAELWRVITVPYLPTV